MLISQFRVPDTIHAPLGFCGLDPAKAIRKYVRGLPHWRQEGATYFLTFRQADSLPRVWMEQWMQENETWEIKIRKEEESRGGSVSRQIQDDWQAFQRESMVRLEAVLDAGSGSCCLAQPESRKLVEDVLLHSQNDKYKLHAFTIMPNHVHLAVTPLPGNHLENILKAWKGYSARLIHRRLGLNGQFWQHENFDRIIRDIPHFQKVVRYIARNPILAKLRPVDACLWIDTDLEGPASGVVREGTSGWPGIPW